MDLKDKKIEELWALRATIRQLDLDITNEIADRYELATRTRLGEHNTKTLAGV
jgi:hypothetical protein